MASSSSNAHVALEVREESIYPYPSHVCAPNFVTLKLSGGDKFGVWKTQMLCLLKSHGMYGFIDGTFVNPETSSSVYGKEKVGDHETHHSLWTRSDSLVKGWILGSLSEQALIYVVDRLTEKLHQETNGADFSAKDVWDELQTIYAPTPLPQVPLVQEKLHQETNGADFSAKDVWDELQTIYSPTALPQLPLVQDEQEEKEEEDSGYLQDLYEAILRGSWNQVERILIGSKVTVLDKIRNNGNTALHVAVGAIKKPEFLEKMLGLAPDNTHLLDLRNPDGSTLLHVAAIVGNTEAARILMERNPDLLLAKDNEGQTPLAIALSNMHTQTAQLLLQQVSTRIQRETLFSGTSGDELLVTAISSKDFGLANDLLQHYKTVHSDAVLKAIAQNSPCELNSLEKYIGTDTLHDKASEAINTILVRSIQRFPTWVALVITIFIILSSGIYWIFRVFLLLLRMLVWPFIKETVRVHRDAMVLQGAVCRLTLDSKHSSSYNNYYTNPILEATRQNAYEAVCTIVTYFPNAILSANEDGHNIIQYAVINRSEKVYNLLYQMSEHRNIYRTIKDSSGNNLLHLAARLAPTNKLNLISGAALQIQRELQWFKEVEGFVCPLNTTQKNSYDETPRMTFTREHKELVNEGEKWMKATAESYTITAALIITIVFAAAITVPGGNNQDTGIPVFTNDIVFTIFAISDAISLFAAVTSLLMFLSILTARFAEQDFLFKLPTKLMIGLATLFISTTAMTVAFGATLYLVFGQRNSRILIPIAVLTCVPITSFVTLQLPLVIDMISATYGRSIFGNKSIFGKKIYASFY